MSSIETVGSVDSVGSIGIGAEAASFRLKIIPEGSLNPNERLYDCIVFLIYCPEHRNIAVINSTRMRLLWLPFVQLRDDLTWLQGSIDGIERTIGRQDAELDEATAKIQSPKYRMDYLDITRIQIPSMNFITRICQLVTLKPNNEFVCCTNSNQIEWISLIDIVKNDSDNYERHWGPELKLWCLRLYSLVFSKLCMNGGPSKLICEQTMTNALYFYSSDMSNTSEHKAMLGMKIKAEHAMEIYEDYLKHCYPSLFMCFESFKSYLIKFGFYTNQNSKTPTKPNAEASQCFIQNSNINRVYDSFRYKKNDCLDFHEIFLGIVVMDPNCKDKCEARIRHLFRPHCTQPLHNNIHSSTYQMLLPSFPSIVQHYRYYTSCKNFFSVDDLKRMIAEIFPNIANNKSEITSQYNEILQQFSVPEATKVSFTVFYKAVMNQTINVSRLLRLPRSLVSHISLNYGQKLARKNNASDIKQKVVTVNGDECLACRAHKYDYGIHYVTFDTAGRCVDPRVINKNWMPEPANQQHRIYSLEYTFSFKSVSNIFLDFVKDFNRHKSLGLLGLMSNKEDWNTLLKYLKILCRLLNGVLLAEPKILKINAPAIVIGDIQGNLSDLLSFEESLYQGFPVISENLLFLGNYSGECLYGVECLIYLFALKICSPNKVFLLRGYNETRIQSSKNLRGECFQRYGRVKGNLVFEAFNDVFAKLPIAAIIDESILCLHSGIPCTTNKISDLLNVPKQIANVREVPIVYEILTRYPLTCYNNNVTVDPQQSLSVNSFLDERVGDLAFHSNAQSCSLTSFESNSFSELMMNSAEIKSVADEVNNSKTNNVCKLNPQVDKKCLPSKTNESEKSTSKKSSTVKCKANKERADASAEIKVPELGDNQTYERRTLIEFLQLNDLNYLLRSSSICKKGYKLNFQNKCLTVFSCSNFRSFQNDAAAVLIDRGSCRIRFLSLEQNGNN